MAALQRILALNQRRRRPRSQLVYVNQYIRNNFNPLDVLSDSAILSKYRLPRVEILQLLEIVSPHISRSTRCNFALSPEVQLLAALRFYAVGSFLEVVGDGIGLSKASVSRSVEAVTNILVHHAQAHIKMPATRVEIQQAHQGFHAVAGIPQVIGLVDGTLIPVSNPSMDDPTFICRKGYSAINTQVVVDHNGLIVDVVGKWPGSTHDSYVWANSAVGQDAARGVFGRSFFLEIVATPSEPT